MGRISFGQQAFFVVGAYAAGVATALHGASLAAGLVAGTLAAALGAALFALPLAGTRGLYFAAGSLAFAELVRVALMGLTYRVAVGPDLVGPAGADGFRGIRALFTSGASVGAYALWVYALLALTVLGLSGALASRWGEALRMIGEDEDAAAAVGVRVGWVKGMAMA